MSQSCFVKISTHNINQYNYNVQCPLIIVVVTSVYLDTISTYFS